MLSVLIRFSSSLTFEYVDSLLRQCPRHCSKFVRKRRSQCVRSSSSRCYGEWIDQMKLGTEKKEKMTFFYTSCFGNARIRLFIESFSKNSNVFKSSKAQFFSSIHHNLWRLKYLIYSSYFSLWLCKTKERRLFCYFCVKILSTKLKRIFVVFQKHNETERKNVLFFRNLLWNGIF